MADLYIGERRRSGRLLYLVIVAAVLLLSSRFLAGTLIDYEWWQEMRQLDTWFSLLIYGWGPAAVAALLLFAAFFSAFRAGISHYQRSTPLFGFLSRQLL